MNILAPASGGSVAFTRVLLVDDSVVLRRLAVMALHSIGTYEVDEARDPFEAFELLETGSYDLVITDLYMPGMDGIEFSKRLRAAPSTCAVPIILVTGDRERSVEREAAEHGIDAVLVKPLDPRTLADTLELCRANGSEGPSRHAEVSSARLIDAFPFPVMVVDEHGSVLMGNAEFWDAAGRGFDDLGVNCSELGLPCHDVQLCPVKQSALSGAPASIRVLNGSTSTRVTAYPLAHRGAGGPRVFLHLSEPQ